MSLTQESNVTTFEVVLFCRSQSFSDHSPTAEKTINHNQAGPAVRYPLPTLDPSFF